MKIKPYIYPKGCTSEGVDTVHMFVGHIYTLRIVPIEIHSIIHGYHFIPPFNLFHPLLYLFVPTLPGNLRTMCQALYEGDFSLGKEPA